MKKILFTTILLVLSSVALVAVGYRAVVAQDGHIYIRANGSVEYGHVDGTPPIERNGDLYTLTSAAACIVIQRSNIVLDGGSYSIASTAHDVAINVSMVSNVTIKNARFVSCQTGVYCNDSSFNNIINNIFEINSFAINFDNCQNSLVKSNLFQENELGVGLLNACHNTVINENDFSNNRIAIWRRKNCDYCQIVNNNVTSTTDKWKSSGRTGIDFYGSGLNCKIVQNRISNQEYGVNLDSSEGNDLYGNIFENCGLHVFDSLANNVSTNTVNGKPLVYMENVSDRVIQEAGQVILVGCSNVTVENLNLTNSTIGVELWKTMNSRVAHNELTGNNLEGIYLGVSNNNTIIGNSVQESTMGVYLQNSTGNSIVNNIVRANSQGFYSGDSSQNFIYHNNIINNTLSSGSYNSLNAWDNGYPDGGNYWSDYVGSDTNLDGIGDALYPYIIDANNKDHYPLMGMFSEFNATPEQSVQAIYNSSVSDFQFDNGVVRFDVSGEKGANGFCRLCIPTALMSDAYRVLVNGTEVSCTLLPCSNATHNYLYFNYTLNASATQRRVLLRTNMGNMLIELYNDMPITTANFINLTKMGIYDNTIFHRVVEGFIIQGGDPTGTGNGDPSISPIPDELPNRHSNTRGAIAMAKTTAPNSATSQFFINLVNNTYLDDNYSVFGEVIEGMDVVDKISRVPTDSNDRPLSKVTVTKAELFEYTTVEIVIIPEFPLPLLSLLLVLMTLFAMAICVRHWYN
jgi:peptidylprolyl isomerase